MKIKKIEEKPMQIHRVDGSKIKPMETVKDRISTGAKIAGNATGKAVTDQVEGGEEVQHAVVLIDMAYRPVKKTASGAKFVTSQAKRMKKLEQGRRLARRSATKVAKRVAQKSAKQTAKKTTKETVKTATKIAVTSSSSVAGATAGTAVAPGAGTAVGFAAGEAAGELVGYQIDKQFHKAGYYSRVMQFGINKLRNDGKGRDSVPELLRDLLVHGVAWKVKQYAKVYLKLFISLISIVLLISMPLIFAVGILYNSPFALFIPTWGDSEETITSVASEYVADFKDEVESLAAEHENCDEGQVVYLGFEDDEAPSNYHDILAVYMVKYGIEDTAATVNDKAKTRLQTVVDDMCSYTTSTVEGTYEIEVETADEDGNITTETQTVTGTILKIEVTLLTWQDMIEIYDFNEDEQKLLEELITSEYMDQI